jgi:hypothetical protein
VVLSVGGMEVSLAFNMQGAQTYYYGAMVSDGRMVGDLHGAIMMACGECLFVGNAVVVVQDFQEVTCGGCIAHD